MRAIIIAVFATFLFNTSLAVQADDPSPSVSTPASHVGVTPYQANKWGIVRVGLANSTDRDAQVLVSSSIGKVKTNQYGREFWVPARSRRASWHSLFMPKAPSNSTRNVAVDTIVRERRDGTERILRTPSGSIAYDGVLSYSGSNSPTAVIVDIPESPIPVRLTRQTETAITAVKACQFSSQNRRTTLEMSMRFLPPVTTGWDGTGHVVLVGDQLADETAAMTALRRWVMRGGRIWIMLDLVKQSTVERLLGDGCPYREVDRVGLTSVRIQVPQGSFRIPDKESRDYEQPIQLARILATGVTVTHTINGWPAAFQQQYGRGSILYTTLGMRAWLRDTGPSDRDFSVAGIRHAPKAPLMDLMADFYAFQQPELFESKLFDEYLSQQIGYQVVERHTVLIVLATFCSGLLLAGAWLARRRRLGLLVWVGPFFALAASGWLVFVGMRSRHAVPNTIATVQLVEVASESDDVNVTGLLAVYRQGESTEQVAVTGGGIISPEPASRPGATRRMVWTDIDSWHWENAALPAGVSRSTIRFSRSIVRPIEAIGRFGPNGLSGRLDTGPFMEPGDAVFASVSRRQIAVRIEKDGSFIAGPDEMLDRGEFIRGLVLSDEQRRRNKVYRKLLPSDRKKKQINKPTMFVWTRPIETGLRISRDEGFRGSALLSIPLRLEHTEPGKHVRIPGAFLPFRGIRGPDGFESSGQLNNTDGTWLERARPGRTWMRVKIPPEVLPLRMKRFTVTLHITGKKQPVKIIEMADGKPRVLAARDNPVGIQRIEIDTTDSLRIDSSGEVMFGLFIGDTASLDDLQPKAISGEKWNVEFLYVEIAGTTLDKSH